MLKKILLPVLVLAGMLIFLIMAGEGLFFLNVPRVYSENGNAIWLDNSWTGKSHTGEEYAALAARLKLMKISDAYFLTGSLNKEGAIDPESYKFAPDLIKGIKKHAPGIRVQAWLAGSLSCSGGDVDISDLVVRNAIVETSRRLLDAGYDGIHLNLEHIWSGDENFIMLLRDIRKITTSKDKILSSATDRPLPFPLQIWIVRILNGSKGLAGYWERDYFLKVARELDQVAVMTYNGQQPTPSGFGNMAAWITEWSVNNGVKKLYLGVPTYREINYGHHPFVENMNTGLIGLKKGVSRLKPEDRKKVGVAIFADWTTNESDLRVYLKKWIRPGGRED